MLRFLIKQYALFGKFFTSALSRSVFNDLHSFSLFPISTSKKAWVSENFEYNIPLLYPLLFTDMLLTQLFWNDSLWQYANFKFYWTYYWTQNIERNQLTHFFISHNVFFYWKSLLLLVKPFASGPHRMNYEFWHCLSEQQVNAYCYAMVCFSCSNRTEIKKQHFKHYHFTHQRM